ncbi:MULTISPECIES: cupin domain-containing protein [Hyphobacterium]|uniref:Cupin domain-containing protein n=1 Tax=Hyphobacterium vulgare TaxID=1736751 RepID=A0ABV6ZV56_9PROT
MARLTLSNVEVKSGSGYPEPFNRPCQARQWQELGEAAGLSQYGVNLVRVPPGSWSSQRHWHTHEDEFVYLIEGEAVLVTDSGESVMRPGDFAGFPAGDGDGHHLQNRSDRDAVFLVVGSRRELEDEVHYSDIDLHLPNTPDEGRVAFTRKDGTPY